ncbi:LysM peptidoglycan-binding domain-containing protein [Flavobacterium galactosidilyticum]|uniref:peptidoglycan endopeptidase n=1 Tax=Flavobacterium galactosidilyticum TaxID=2893886 RepID=UPI001E46567C|nr:peptidoglycan endopeptidase [Flavobacterium sp. F-340]UFH46556.1 LysM peptidoglycan-binding domain-containing protein [Flavobacterium sp. F-340]
MSLRVIVTIVFLNSMFLFAQEKNIKHTIIKGETISSIATKYDVKQSEIFKLNPSAKKLLKLNSVLLIPVSALQKSNNKSATTPVVQNIPASEHEVLAKETLYGIARQYGISVNELSQLNPILASTDLKIGQKINVPAAAIKSEIAVVTTTKTTPQKQEIIRTAVESPTTFVWEVQPKETKYSITKKYGITIKEFDKVNPELGVKSLRVGQKINIPGNPQPIAETVVAAEEKKELSKIEEKLAVAKVDLPQKENNTVAANTVIENNSISTIVREVLPKETKYAIAKQYGITVQELEKQNPEIKRKLLVGHKLTISGPNLPAEESKIAVSGNSSNSEILNSKIDFNNRSVQSFHNTAFLDQLIEEASENIGTRYRTGGTSKSGFDCSGLMLTTYGAFDIKLPRTSREQSSIGTKISTEEAQKGDLIFFKTNGRSQINHVGMVVEVNEGEIKFIHSSVSNGVIISSTKERYYQKNFSQINRVLQ